MKPSIVLGAVAAAFSLAALSAPSTASASCSDRKATGTILGGVGGALIGNSISGGGGGAILGGLGGAVAGHAIAGAGCGRYRHAYYERDRYYGSRRYGARDYAYRGAGYATPTRTVYYDQRGNLLPAAEPVGVVPGSYVRTSYGAGGCGVDQSYYDGRGNLVQRPALPCR